MTLPIGIAPKVVIHGQFDCSENGRLVVSSASGMTSGWLFLTAAIAVVNSSIVRGGFSGSSPAFDMTDLLYQKPAGASVHGSAISLP